MLADDEMRDALSGFAQSAYEDEVKGRWGDTEAYRESTRRTQRYTKEDWARFKAESDAVSAALAALIDEGVAPDDPRATDAVERHRLLIDRWSTRALAPCKRRSARCTSPTCASRRPTGDPPRHGALHTRRDGGERGAGAGARLTAQARRPRLSTTCRRVRSRDR